MRNGPDGRRFVWGKIAEVHEVGRYQIVEATPNHKSDLKPATQFYVYVDGVDASLSAHTLDEALLLAIAHANAGRGEAATAARYMAKLAGI